MARIDTLISVGTASALLLPFASTPGLVPGPRPVRPATEMNLDTRQASKASPGKTRAFAFGLVAYALAFRDSPAFSPRKFSNSAFTSSACVHVMQCGPSFTTDRRAPLISLAVRSPEAVIGRMRSASP